jgi:hypothetical protein
MMDDHSTHDDLGHEPGLPRGTGLRVIVCAAGAAVGAFFGSFAYPTGTVLGGAGGVLAGLVWTRVMLRRSKAGYSRARLVRAGAGWGIVVGLLATAVLHGGLILHDYASVRTPNRGGYLDGLYPLVLVVAAACAVIGGAVTGTLCGGIVPTNKDCR